MERLGETLTWGGSPDTSGTNFNPGGPVFLPSIFTPTNTSLAVCTLAGNWAYTLGVPPYMPPSNQTQYDTLHFQVLSDMVFRMEFCFLLKSGTYALSGATVTTGSSGYSNAPTALSPPGSSSASVWSYITNNYFFGGGTAPDLAGNVYGFPPDLAGVVVTIAVLDKTSRKMVPPGGLASLAAALPDSFSGDTTLGPAGIQSNPELPAQVWQSDIFAPGFGAALSPPIPQQALAQVRIFEHTFYLNPN
jgi:hypothetical protein